MRVTAIILAAGKGRRFQSRLPKPLAVLGSCPLILYSLNRFIAHPLITDIVVAVNDGNKRRIGRLIRHKRYTKSVRLVPGGKRRQDSVRRALEALDGRTEYLLIHDAARPLVERRMISDVVACLSHAQAVITAVPVKATIKSIKRRVARGRSGTVKETLDRSQLVEVQTPQGFRREILQEAYRRFGRSTVTDDARLIEKLGVPVRVVMGSYANIKITTPEDLVIADALLKSQRSKARKRWTIG